MSEPDSIILQQLRAIRERLDVIEVNGSDTSRQIENLTAAMQGISLLVHTLVGNADEIERRLSALEEAQ